MTPVERSSVVSMLAMTAVGMVVGRLLTPLMIRFTGEAQPPTSVGAAVWLFLGAVVIAMIALQNWRTLHRDKRQMSSRHAIRVLAIAKAGVVVACIFLGGHLGLALYSFGVETPMAELRLWRNLLAGGAAILLLAASLVLEWTCRIPEDGDGDGKSLKGHVDPTPA